MLRISDEPLGYRLDGRPFWVYLGGSEGAPEGDDDGRDGDDGDEGDDDGDIDESKVPDAVKSLIARERADAKKARDGMRPWRILAKELGVKSPEEIKALLAKTSDDKTNVADAVRKAEADVLSRANTKILKSEIKALAADLLADPGDAVLNLNLGDYEVDEDGNVPERAIKRDLKDLLARKPHLAKVSKRVDYEGGARGGAGRGGTGMNDLIRRAAGKA